MAINQILKDIEILLQNQSPEKSLYQLYRYNKKSHPDEFVLALIGKLVEEHKLRESSHGQV